MSSICVLELLEYPFTFCVHDLNLMFFLFLEADFFARLSHPTCCDFCYHHDYKVCIENYPSIFNSFKCVENLENPEHMKGPLQIPWAKCHN